MSDLRNMYLELRAKEFPVYVYVDGIKRRGYYRTIFSWQTSTRYVQFFYLDGLRVCMCPFKEHEFGYEYDKKTEKRVRELERKIKNQQISNKVRKDPKRP